MAVRRNSDRSQVTNELLRLQFVGERIGPQGGGKLDEMLRCGPISANRRKRRSQEGLVTINKLGLQFS
jgi:hypothetical protein